MAGLMIAEDELIERMVLKKMLQKKFGEQCTIYEAQNGHEAVELARREEIQVDRKHAGPFCGRRFWDMVCHAVEGAAAAVGKAAADDLFPER